MTDGQKRIPASFYRSGSRSEPVREWLKELKPEDRHSIGLDIMRVEYGWPIGMPAPEARSLRGPQFDIGRAYRTGDILRLQRANGSAAWFYQEIAENAAAGSGSGPETQEGGRAAMTNQHIGSPFEDFLKEEGIFEEVQVQAIKEVLAWQIRQAIKTQGLTKAEMARRMQTSRAQLDRLLNPKNTSVTLHTLERVAAILGKRVRLDLVEAPESTM
jgi:antitoxin HicB